MREDGRELETAMAQMLRAGVLVAALVVLAGGILRLGQSHEAAPDFRHFRGAPAAYEHIGSIVQGVGRLDGGSLIQLGILLLIATPVCRVFIGVVGFALMRDWLYAAVSAIVLAVLMFSFFAKR
jgi:uncharacterized membrane protein